MIATDASPFVPPAPVPQRALPSAFGLYRHLRTNPLGIWTDEHYSAAVLVNQTPLGRRIVVSRPDGVRRVLVDNTANYDRDGMQRAILDRFSGDSMFAAEGACWKSQRHALAPLFTPSRIVDYAPAMAAAAERGATWMLEAADRGQRSQLLHEMATIAVDVLGTTILADSIDPAPDEVARRSDAMMREATRIGVLDIAGAPAWLPRVSRLRAHRHRGWFVRLGRQIVERGRAGRTVSDLVAAVAKHDAEARPLFTDRQRRDNVAMFIGAGHETVAQTLTWALYLVASCPGLDDELAKEARLAAGSTVDERPLARAVIEEAMRLYPPAPTLTRRALAADVVADTDIRRGDVLIIAPWLIHRHRSLWSAPEVFDPTRFLPPRRQQIDRYAYLPFGAGPRVCIGMAYALQEAVIVISHLLSRLRFAIVPGQVIEPLQRVTLRPRHDIKVEVQERA